MSPEQEKKLDQVLEKQNLMAIDIAVIKEKQDANKTKVDKVEKDVEKLKIWKYTSLTGLGTAIASFFQR